MQVMFLKALSSLLGIRVLLRQQKVEALFAWHPIQFTVAREALGIAKLLEPFGKWSGLRTLSTP